MEIVLEEISLDKIFMYAVFFGLPILFTVLFLISLILFLTAKKNTQKRSNYKTVLIVTGIVAGLLDLTAGLLGLSLILSLGGAG